MKQINELKKSEWNKEFIELMNNRMIMGAFRYGKLKEQPLQFYNFPIEAMKRISKYNATHNLEHLIDAANMLMIQYTIGKQDGEQVISIDDGEHNKKC